MREMGLGAMGLFVVAAIGFALAARPAGACSVQCGQSAALVLIDVVSASGHEGAPPVWASTGWLSYEPDGAVSFFEAGEFAVQLREVGP
jgi:hypothetical protein